MKQTLIRHSIQSALLVTMLLGLAACDNQVSFSPTTPTFGDFPATVGELKTLQISGSLVADQGSCLKATILFDGQEINGARSRCDAAQGCAQLELAGTVSSLAGHHTITFKVLRQSVETDHYLGTGTVALSGLDLQLPDLAVVLQPAQATLQAGEGLTFEIDLWD